MVLSYSRDRSSFTIRKQLSANMATVCFLSESAMYIMAALDRKIERKDPQLLGDNSHQEICFLIFQEKIPSLEVYIWIVIKCVPVPPYWHVMAVCCVFCHLCASHNLSGHHFGHNKGARYGGQLLNRKKTWLQPINMENIQLALCFRVVTCTMQATLQALHGLCGPKRSWWVKHAISPKSDDIFMKGWDGKRFGNTFGSSLTTWGQKKRTSMTKMGAASTQISDDAIIIPLLWESWNTWFHTNHSLRLCDYNSCRCWSL